jgi:hypothetical protein
MVRYPALRPGGPIDDEGLGHGQGVQGRSPDDAPVQSMAQQGRVQPQPAKPMNLYDLLPMCNGGEHLLSGRDMSMLVKEVGQHDHGDDGQVQRTSSGKGQCRDWDQEGQVEQEGIVGLLRQSVRNPQRRDDQDGGESFLSVASKFGVSISRDESNDTYISSCYAEPVLDQFEQQIGTATSNDALLHRGNSGLLRHF